MTKRFKHRGLTVALAVAALFAVQPAVADSLSFDGFYYSGTPSNYSGTDTVHIYDTDSPSLNEYAYSGGFKMTDTSGSTRAPGTSFLAWCIDIRDNMHSASYTLTSSGSYTPSFNVPLGATQITALERLASNNLGSVLDAKTSSAFQLAAWEIMAEDRTLHSYNVSTNNGNFYTSGDAMGADVLANTWLSNLGTAAPTMGLSVWRADRQGSTQDLAVFSEAPLRFAAPVPEPETYAMMLAGLGMLGFVARRRKQKASA